GGERITVGGEVVVRFSFSDATEEALVKRLYESSTRDPLTGVFTRRYFAERIEAELAYARRHKTPLGLLMLGLDHFKIINYAHGHAGGGAVLRAVATHAMHLTRTEDIFARYGGEEFVLLVRGIKPKQMLQLAERVRKSVGNLQIPFMGR